MIFLKSFKNITILLAAHNGSQFLSEQLDSIFNQNKMIVNLIIGLDPSEDNSLNIIKNKIKNKKNVKLYIYKKKSGSAAKNFYKLINYYIKKKNYTSLIGFSDQDDIWLKNKLLRAKTIIKKNNCHAYSSDLTAFYKDNKMIHIKKSLKQVKYDYIYQAPSAGCTIVIKHKFLEKINFLIKKNLILKDISHDWMLYAFLRSRSYKWFSDNQSHILYRQHNNNVAGANLGLKAKFKRIIGFFTWYIHSQKIIYDYFAKKDLKANIFSNLFNLRRSKFESFILSIFRFIKILK